MFQKFNTSEFFRESLKSLSFIESLKVLRLKTKNTFTRLIKEAYPDFKTSFDEIFEFLGQADFKYIGLYIQGKLHPCPECGRYCLKKCCSKECSYKHSYFSEFFKETLKTKDFKTALRKLHEKLGSNKFTAEVNRLYPEYKSQFDELLQELGAPDTTYISLYIEDKLSKCKACGKTVIKPRVYCCSECYGKDFDYSITNKNKDYKKSEKRFPRSFRQRPQNNGKNNAEKQSKLN